jgi:hypothetical protein
MSLVSYTCSRQCANSSEQKSPKETLILSTRRQCLGWSRAWNESRLMFCATNWSARFNHHLVL